MAVHGAVDHLQTLQQIGVDLTIKIGKKNDSSVGKKQRQQLLMGLGLDRCCASSRPSKQEDHSDHPFQMTKIKHKHHEQKLNELKSESREALKEIFKNYERHEAEILPNNDLYRSIQTSDDEEDDLENQSMNMI